MPLSRIFSSSGFGVAPRATRARMYSRSTKSTSERVKSIMPSARLGLRMSSRSPSGPWRMYFCTGPVVNGIDQPVGHPSEGCRRDGHACTPASSVVSLEHPPGIGGVGRFGSRVSIRHRADDVPLFDRSAHSPRIDQPLKPASPHFEPAVLRRRQRLETYPVWPRPSAYHNGPAKGIPFTGPNDRPDVPKLTSAGHPGMIGQWSPRSSLTASPSMMSC